MTTTKSWLTCIGLGVISLGVAGAGAYYLVQRRRRGATTEREATDGSGEGWSDDQCGGSTCGGGTCGDRCEERGDVRGDADEGSGSSEVERIMQFNLHRLDRPVRPLFGASRSGV